MSPRYNKKEFIISFSNGCFSFSGNKDLDNFEWCITRVEDDVFFIQEDLDTIYYIKDKTHSLSY